MAREQTGEVARALAAHRAGEPQAFEEVLKHVYGHLRALAGSYMRRLPANQTLEPTALVNEAFVRLLDQSRVEWKDRSHFFALCAKVMRGILADHARSRAAAKRGGDWQRITLNDLAVPTSGHEVDLLDLDRALDRLAELHERQARIVECRFFAGMTEEEVAEALEVSRTTVSAEWKMARAWLNAQLTRSRDEP